MSNPNGPSLPLSVGLYGGPNAPCTVMSSHFTMSYSMFLLLVPDRDAPVSNRQVSFIFVNFGTSKMLM